MNDLHLTEALAALTTRIDKQEISIRFLLEAVSVALNPSRPEYACEYLLKAQKAALNEALIDAKVRKVITELIAKAREQA